MNKSTRNQLIHKIKEYIPNEKIEFRLHKITGAIQIIFIDKHAIMSITDCNTWDEIKRHIDAKISNEKSNECSICFTDKIKKRRVSCAKCANNWCVYCYIEIFRENNGLIVCPFCRYTYGNRFPSFMVELGVKEILQSIDN
jgi:uncharacterized paraquat-inducible protein A